MAHLLPLDSRSLRRRPTEMGSPGSILCSWRPSSLRPLSSYRASCRRDWLPCTGIPHYTSSLNLRFFTERLGHSRIQAVNEKAANNHQPPLMSVSAMTTIGLSNGDSGFFRPLSRQSAFNVSTNAQPLIQSHELGVMKDSRAIASPQDGREDFETRNEIQEAFRPSSVCPIAMISLILVSLYEP